MFTGPPVLKSIQQLVYYRKAGKPFTSDCIATNDPQSPNELRLRWFKDSSRIKTGRQWTIISRHAKNGHTVTVTSTMLIVMLNVDQHNGTYTCSVDNFMITAAINQSITLIVESECFYIISIT